jgi:hypothetical protein
MIVNRVLRDPLLTRRMPTRLLSFRIQNDMIWERRAHSNDVDDSISYYRTGRRLLQVQLDAYRASGRFLRIGTLRPRPVVTDARWRIREPGSVLEVNPA